MYRYSCVANDAQFAVVEFLSNSLTPAVCSQTPPAKGTRRATAAAPTKTAAAL